MSPANPAGPGPGDGSTSAPDSGPTNSTNLPPIKAVGPGIFELGKVRFDKAQRTVSFPAVLNMDKGLMEYLVVTSYGKTHESVLRTGVSPLHIQLAMLLLDAKGAGTNVLNTAPQTYGGTPGVKIPGDPISIEVSWRQDGKQITRRAEELVARQETKTELRNTSWIYNGSLVWQGTFVAQQDGSLISLITDAGALINNVPPKGDEDQTWTTNPDKLPPPEVLIQVTIKLLADRSQK